MVVLSTESCKGIGVRGSPVCWLGSGLCTRCICCGNSGRLLCLGLEEDGEEQASLTFPAFLPGGELLHSHQHPPGSLPCVPQAEQLCPLYPAS